jgi:uncharacterized protein YaeQ
MALKATIFKVHLQIADMDREHYQDHALTLARHPSENDLRMMIRLLAFALNADSALTFTRGLSTEDEPDLWQKNLSGEIELWIDVGQPDERRIRKACGRAHQVIIYNYNEASAKIWWSQIRDTLKRFDNLRVFSLSDSSCEKLTKLAQRNMQLQCTIQDAEAWLSDDTNTVMIRPEPRHP